MEWLNGAVVRYGQRAGVKTPVNKVLTDILLALTRGNPSVDSYSHQPEKLLSQIN